MSELQEPLFSSLPQDWQGPLGRERGASYVARLEAFLASERAAHRVFPPPCDVFRALELTPFDRVRVVILGQDPYHDEGQAHGLAFSVRPGTKPPPSLVNIFKELESDLGIARPSTGCLEPWARQGVLLLNATLTVRAHVAGSHQGQGWETFTDGVIRAVAGRAAATVFVLWGAHAQKKSSLIEQSRTTLGAHVAHVTIVSAHPSPLSAHRGFFGSRPFSRIDAAFLSMGQQPIDWRIP